MSNHLQDNPELGRALERYRQWELESRLDDSPVGMFRTGLERWHEKVPPGEPDVYARVITKEASAVFHSREHADGYDVEVFRDSQNPAERFGPVILSIPKRGTDMIVDSSFSGVGPERVNEVLPALLAENWTDEQRLNVGCIRKKRYDRLRDRCSR